VAHRGGTLGLLVAIAIGTTAWAATDGTGAQKASPGATSARVQVLRIVEAKQGAQPEIRVLPKSKKVARQKVIGHRPVLTHQRAPAIVPGVAKSSNRLSRGKANVGNPTLASLADNETAATPRNAAEEGTSSIRVLTVKTQNAEWREQGKVLPGATPIRSPDLWSTSGQVAARWPLASEVFTPLASSYEHAPSQTQSGDARLGPSD
jgi:hypothetical protein